MLSGVNADGIKKIVQNRPFSDILQKKAVKSCPTSLCGVWTLNYDRNKLCADIRKQPQYGCSGAWNLIHWHLRAVFS